jgi:RNA polymerase-associated protein CTR9
MMQDFDGAKFRLEKIIATHKSAEAMTLLGILYAEDVFNSQAAGSKDDKTTELKKAIAYLEQVRISWKDPKKKVTPDSAVLLNLARLYESEQPEKALQCLQEVEKMEMDEIPDGDLPLDLEDEASKTSAKRGMLSPQLLNNIACFFYQAEKLSQAREYFQAALNSSVSIREKDETIDTDALVSTISFNLARTYEAQGIEEQAKEIYNGLLERHPDYIDAKTRLAYISHQNDPAAGAEAIQKLLEFDPANLEARSLYGWYINKHKKRTLALDQDQEQKHYKHTLRTYDKHDIYSLTAMGNVHLTIAREMPKDTDQHKDRRSKTYMRAVEFFDKVLTLDPKNAFAAQGLGIAVVEEKKDLSAAVQVFSKVRESIKDASVHINLGHVFCDLKQYSRSIENYELALAKSKNKDPHIMACLGRVWLMRGRAEKSSDAFQTSLDYSQQAYAASPANINFKFNVAFVQNQIAQHMIGLPESAKSLADVEAASAGLDSAIEAFAEIAKSPTPPYPRHDIEQRANMARNTMKRQLASAIEKQTEYEQKNASKLEEARKRREDAARALEQAKREAAEKEEAARRKVREERERMMAEDRELAERRLEEEKIREQAQYTTDEETGERKKREKKPKEKKGGKRKKKGVEDSDLDDLPDGEGSDEDVVASGRSRSRRDDDVGSVSGSDAETREKPRKKKRKLERKSAASAAKNSKFKSAETVMDSDEDDEDGGDDGIRAPAAATANASDDAEPDRDGAEAGDDTMVDVGGVDDEDEDDGAVASSRATQRRGKTARVLDDDEDE